MSKFNAQIKHLFKSKRFVCLFCVIKIVVFGIFRMVLIFFDFFIVELNDLFNRKSVVAFLLLKGSIL